MDWAANLLGLGRVFMNESLTPLGSSGLSISLELQLTSRYLCPYFFHDICKLGIVRLRFAVL